MAPYFNKLVRGINRSASEVKNYFQKGGHEILFRKIKNTAKDLQPLANTIGKYAGEAAPILGQISPVAGAAAMGVSRQLPGLVNGITTAASDFQQASKRPRNNLERPPPADAASRQFM